eukprot:CAMPEP_0115020860 /NCGR_PEP_ID=MMETSP0216-20121206/30485_1 /TAXON_ID=223996 /ORGANISM="Protocruzia adherens, Strain Boccale" /LENGTH=191 /DNA_ID=CAMNT_0002392991 /DNA_START=130 /DNA_END=705 /DNA_ORIENTATION=-
MKHIITWNIENIIHTIGHAFKPSTGQNGEGILKDVGFQNNNLCASLLLIKKKLQDLNLPPDELKDHLERAGQIPLEMFESIPGIECSQLAGVIGQALGDNVYDGLVAENSKPIDVTSLIKTKPIRAEDCDPKQLGEEISKMFMAKERIGAFREQQIHKAVLQEMKTGRPVCDDEIQRLRDLARSLMKQGRM